MKAESTRHIDGAALRFILLVILETTINTVTGLLYSFYVGKISASSLATINLGNSFFTVFIGIFSMLTTGATILSARLIGAKEHSEATNVLEQALHLTVVATSIVSIVCIAFAVPIVRIIMPGVDDAVFSEGLAFFRVLMLSLLPQMVVNVLVSSLRAAGDGRFPVILAIVMNMVLLLGVILFVRVMGLDAVGAGLAYLVMRVVGAVLCFLITARSHNVFTLRFANMLRPRFDVIKRILRIGLPACLESTFVQIGYLVGNSMVIGLGTHEAAVYSVANALYSFAATPQTICSCVAMTLIGQLIGAKQYQKAKKQGWTIWCIGMFFSFLLSFIIVFGVSKFAGYFTQDEAVMLGTQNIIWCVFWMCVPALSLNALDPQLRVGGDVRYVMLVTLVAVWAIRLPLTYLFCYKLSWGAAGVFWANTISLTFRAVFNMIRFIKGKYLTMRV